MPFEITLNDLPAGYAASAGKKGEKVSVITREFTSSEDGDIFISRLEGYPSQIINSIPSGSGVKSSTVDHLLAIIRRDKTATVYVNELSIVVKATIKGRDIEAGLFIYSDDIADIQKLEFHGITIPDDVGIIVLLSKGWRKGLYYDLKPLVPPDFSPRDYDLEMLCGQYYAYLSFQHLFKLTDAEWDALIAQKWFPFISLKHRTIQEIINYAKAGWNVDGLTEKIGEELTELLPAMLKKWERNNLFQSHLPIFKQAVERYLAGDYISTTSNLYPRIEGLMRTYLSSLSQNIRPSSKNLVASVVDAGSKQRHSFSLLLPNNFRRYLEDVYFANFDPNNPDVLSRHSVAHGVAPVDDYSLKGATIGLLILDQLSFYLGSQNNP
jgi:hypothetical protein